MTHKNIKIQKLSIFKHALESQAIKTNSAGLSSYTEDESVKILETINTLQLADHEKYELSKGRIRKLLEWRKQHGPFRLLNDILSIDGFGVKIAEKFYRSLLREPLQDKDAGGKTVHIRYASFITPTFDDEQRHKIRSSLALRVGVSSVSWARFEVPVAGLCSPCLLTHWEHNEMSGKKLHLQDLVEQCLYLDQRIPEADCYLFENPQTAHSNRNPGSAEQQNISIQKAQIIASLSFALNRRCYGQNHVNRRPNVYYMRRFLTARLFNHLVGTERVSSEETILKMMRTHCDEKKDVDKALEDVIHQKSVTGSPSIRGEIMFPSELRQMFAHSERYHREFLGQCLLLNLAFVRLVVLQDPASAAVINRKSSKESEKAKLS